MLITTATVLQLFSETTIFIFFTLGKGVGGTVSEMKTTAITHRCLCNHLRRFHQNSRRVRRNASNPVCSRNSGIRTDLVHMFRCATLNKQMKHTNKNLGREGERERRERKWRHTGSYGGDVAVPFVGIIGAIAFTIANQFSFHTSCAPDAFEEALRASMA